MFLIRLKKLTPGQFITLGYIFIIIIGTILLLLPVSTVHNKETGFLDAVFTAVSAVSLTGLLVVSMTEHWSLFGQLVIMILIQIGGIGFMTITTMLFLFFGKKLSLRDRLVIMKELNYNRLSDVVQLSRYIITLTFFTELIGAGLLFIYFKNFMPFSQNLLYSIFHSVSAFNNAGFSLFPDSLEGFGGSPFLLFTIVSLFLVGGLGFIVINEVYEKRKFKKLSLHSKLVISINIFLIIGGSLAIFLLEYNNPTTIGDLNLSGKILSSIFHSVTTRSAGFSIIPIRNFRDGTLFIMTILIFIGASPGSTGSGVKTTTVGTLILVVYNMALGKRNIEVFNRRLRKDDIFEALTVVIISLVMIVFLIIVLSLLEDYPFFRIIFEVFSAFGTAGLTSGVTANLTLAGRILIIFTMFIGRIGPFTLALALGRRHHESIAYPEEDILIG